jgi:molecular chaperone GrpE
VEATVRGLLPVLDNLLLALLHAQTDIDRFVPGVQMVASQFRRCLERLGVQQVDASPGARFDPAHHEALLTLASTEIPEGHVITEVRPGYTLNARLLRAAQVSVAGGSVRHAERSLPPAADDTLPDATQPTDREE